MAGTSLPGEGRGGSGQGGGAGCGLRGPSPGECIEDYVEGRGTDMRGASHSDAVDKGWGGSHGSERRNADTRSLTDRSGLLAVWKA